MDDYAALFELGVADYFTAFGHRFARERPHQAWLLNCVSRRIDPQLVVAELTVPNQDLSRFAAIEGSSEGGANFDFAITWSEIDLRTWKTRTPGWKSGESTVPNTLDTLRDVAVLAEFKVSESTSTNVSALRKDLEKLRAAIGFMVHHDCKSLPACFLVVFDSQRVLDTRKAVESVASNWPPCAALPKILVGP